MMTAQLADPRRKDVHWTQRSQGQEMMASIIQRMERLVGSISKNAYIRFSHGRDRSMELEDLVAIVKGELVLAVYRYQKDGKYEPLNYLLGVTHVVLKNVHNRRNRKKRIPLNMLVSMNTPSQRSSSRYMFVSTLEDYLKDNIRIEDDHQNIIDRMEVESIFSSVKDRSVEVKVGNGTKKVRVDLVVKMILDGGSIASVSKEVKVPKYALRNLIKREVVPILQEPE